MRIYINPGHDIEYDSGAVNPNSGLRECDVALKIGQEVKICLEQIGYEVKLLQSDNLCNDSQYSDRPVAVCEEANEWPADLFISIHCNAFNTTSRGTEIECFSLNSEGAKLAQYIQNQIVKALDTIDRGIKEMPQLEVLKDTHMPAVLVETAFIDNDEDADLLMNQSEEFGRAIARGITDYTYK